MTPLKRLFLFALQSCTSCKPSVFSPPQHIRFGTCVSFASPLKNWQKNQLCQPLLMRRGSLTPASDGCLWSMHGEESGSLLGWHSGRCLCRSAREKTFSSEARTCVIAKCCQLLSLLSKNKQCGY